MLRLPLFLAAALALLPVLASPVPAQDPYMPGLRWSEAATGAQPWIARRVAFAGDAQAVWAGRAVGTPGATLYAGTDGQTLEVALDAPLPGAVGLVEVATGRGLGELFVAAQFPVSGGRQTVVERYSAFLEPTQPQVWSAPVGAPANGGALLAVAPSGVWVAHFDAGAGVVHLTALDADTGAQLVTRSMPAAALRGLGASADGERIALALGNRVAVWSAAGFELASFAQPQSNEAFALSADGRVLAAGRMGEVALYEESGGAYAQVGSAFVGEPWLPTRAALSQDGSVLAVGFWNSQTADAIRFVMWDRVAGTKLHDVLQTGVFGGFQNFPEALALSPDGQRLLAGAWGSGGPHPQLMLLDRDQAEPVLSTYTPGSVLAVALDPTGTQVTAAVKSGHANQFSTTGFVQRYATGERDLQLIGSVNAGEPFLLTSRQPQSLASLFVFGQALTPPAPHPAFGGLLAIDPAKAYTHYLRVADGTGRADLQGSVPPGPGFVGLALKAQVVFLGPLGLELSSAAPMLAVH